eukprot:2372587-Amphidinium_carterae.1
MPESKTLLTNTSLQVRCSLTFQYVQSCRLVGTTIHTTMARQGMQQVIDLQALQNWKYKKGLREHAKTRHKR